MQGTDSWAGSQGAWPSLPPLDQAQSSGSAGREPSGDAAEQQPGLGHLQGFDQQLQSPRDGGGSNGAPKSARQRRLEINRRSQTLYRERQKVLVTCLACRWSSDCPAASARVPNMPVGCSAWRTAAADESSDGVSVYEWHGRDGNAVLGSDSRVLIRATSRYKPGTFTIGYILGIDRSSVCIMFAARTMLIICAAKPSRQEKARRMETANLVLSARVAELEAQHARLAAHDTSLAEQLRATTAQLTAALQVGAGKPVLGSNSELPMGAPMRAGRSCSCSSRLDVHGKLRRTMPC